MTTSFVTVFFSTKITKKLTYHSSIPTYSQFVNRKLYPHPLPPSQAIEGDANCGAGNRTLLLFPFANQPNKTDQETQTLSLHTNQVTHQASAYPVVSSMK